MSDNQLIIPDQLRDPEHFFEVLGKLENLKRFVRDADKLFEQAAINYIQEHGPVECGTMKYWIGHDSKTTCIDQDGAVSLLLGLGLPEGTTDLPLDPSALLSCLSSNAVKTGAFKKAVGEENWAQFFKTEKVDTLESGEKLPKRLQKADTKFLTNSNAA